MNIWRFAWETPLKGPQLYGFYSTFGENRPTRESRELIWSDGIFRALTANNKNHIGTRSYCTRISISVIVREIRQFYWVKPQCQMLGYEIWARFLEILTMGQLKSAHSDAEKNDDRKTKTAIAEEFGAPNYRVTTGRIRGQELFEKMRQVRQ